MAVKRHLPSLLFAAVIILIQLVTAATNTAYYLTQLTMAAYYSLVAVGLCMLMGYAGQISLGQAGFFAIGGYTTAVLTTTDFSGLAATGLGSLLFELHVLIPTTDLYGNESIVFSPFVAFLAALCITVIIAVLIGIPVLKLKGHYLAMATLGFGIIIYRIVLGTRLFGEADGITQVPQFKIAGGLAISGDFTARVLNYYIAWVIVIAGMVLLTNLIASRVGRALRTLHGSEEAALAMGVDVPAYKLRIFVLSALFASAAGIFLAHYNGGIGPGEAGVMKSVRYVAIVAVGGMANLWGTLIMGTVLNFLSLRGAFGHYDDAVFGIILILIMLFAPNGLLRREVWRSTKAYISTLKTTVRRIKKQGSRNGGESGPASR
jgi:branched-chain amino acid transport system permease protein